MDRRSHRLATLLAALGMSACAAASPAGAPNVGGATTLLTRLGTDTVAFEQYTRTPTGIDGIVVTRVPAMTVARYHVTIGAGNAPESATISVRRGDGSLLANGIESTSFTFRADSVFVVGKRAAGDTTRRFMARGELLPFVTNSAGLFELAIDRMRSSGRDSVTFASVALNIGANGAQPAPFRFLGSDSLRTTRGGYLVYARHDGRGNLVWSDGTQSTNKTRVDRVAAVDLDTLVKSWAARETAAGQAGAASTRDTARATLGSTALWIDYGRPALRGREVWVNGVLGDTIWRTGANAATQLRASGDVMIGGIKVPAGTYSLFTHANGGGYELIINKQFGQWGTEYHPDRDLARIPLQEFSVGTAVERFTIEFVPRIVNMGGAPGGMGFLKLTWGTKQLSVPVETRQ